MTSYLALTAPDLSGVPEGIAVYAVDTLTTARGVVEAVDGVDLTLERGQAVALIGESGSARASPFGRSCA